MVAPESKKGKTNRRYIKKYLDDNGDLYGFSAFEIVEGTGWRGKTIFTIDKKNQDDYLEKQRVGKKVYDKSYPPQG